MLDRSLPLDRIETQGPFLDTQIPLAVLNDARERYYLAIRVFLGGVAGRWGVFLDKSDLDDLVNEFYSSGRFDTARERFDRKRNTRFRSYLKSTICNFLRDELRRRRNCVAVSLDDLSRTDAAALPDPATDLRMEIAWAREHVVRAMLTTERHCRAEGLQLNFDIFVARHLSAAVPSFAELRDRFRITPAVALVEDGTCPVCKFSDTADCLWIEGSKDHQHRCARCGHTYCVVACRCGSHDLVREAAVRESSQVSCARGCRNSIRDNDYLAVRRANNLYAKANEHFQNHLIAQLTAEYGTERAAKADASFVQELLESAVPGDDPLLRLFRLDGPAAKDPDCALIRDEEELIARLETMVKQPARVRSLVSELRSEKPSPEVIRKAAAVGRELYPQATSASARSAAELLNWLAEAVGCIHGARGHDESRYESRKELLEVFEDLAAVHRNSAFRDAFVLAIVVLTSPIDDPPLYH